MKDHKQLYICECNNSEHQMIFFSIPEDDEKIIYVHTHLSKKPFWKRVAHAIKYIFGYQSRYGAFDEILLGERHAEDLLEAAKYLGAKVDK